MRNGKMRIEVLAEECIDVEIETFTYIDSNIVMDYIENYATEKDLLTISRNMATLGMMRASKITLYDIMKNDILVEAANKYTLEELENMFK